MPEQRPSEKSVFLEAIEITAAAERAAYLDRACKDRPQLRAEVEALLQAHEAPQRVLDAPGAIMPTSAEAAVLEHAGTVIGPYKLLEQIGEGGMGLVFVAEQQHPVRRRVALKLIKPGMDTRQVVARFEAERQALALMDHPHIAHVFDGGETASGRPYFVMELVRGIPITDFCDHNHLSVRERLGLFLDVCQAVQHAHQKGVIHRDLKPSNVLVTLHDGTPVVKVIDFGVAKAVGRQLTEKTVYTRFTEMIGTPLYMSPEQAELSGLDVDTRSDVYALGVLLYELLTGTTPFDKERLKTAAFDEIRRIIREEEPARPSTRLSTLGQAAATVSANRQSDPKHLRQLFRGELDWIVMKALEKDRNRRYESASTFAADVRRYLNDEPVLACPPSAWYRLRKVVRRHKRPVLAVALVLLALVGGIIGTTWGMLRATHAEADAVNEAKQKEDALADARDKLFLALVSQARAERISGRVGQRFEALKAIRQAAQIRVTPELRTEAMAALVLPDVEVAHEWEGWPEDSVGVAFDAAFRRYARLDKQGGLTVCRLSEGREEVVARLPAHGKPGFGGPWMSPDGRFVASAHSLVSGAVFGGVRLWKLDGLSPAVLLDVPEGVHGRALAFRPDGRQMAIGHADRSVSVYDLATGERVRRLAEGSTAIHLAFHPRDSRLALARRNAGVSLFDVDTGKVLTAPRHPESVTWTYSVAWHPDGRRLAAGCNDCNVHVWDTETGTEVTPPWHHGEEGLEVAFNPAGDRLVSVGWGRQPWLWDTANGRLLLKMPGLVGLQFSPDGRLLGHAVSGNRLRLWRVAWGRELAVLRGRGADGRQTIHSPVVHADGGTLAAASDRRLHFFDLATGEELASVRLPHEAADNPVFFDAPRPSPGRDGEEAGAGTGGWVTGGLSGLLLWPARPDPSRPGALRVGSPQQLAPDLKSRFTRGASASSDGSVVAVPDGRFTTVIHRDRPRHRWKLGPQYDVRFTAVSPDGHWVVTGSHGEDHRSKSARIWDADTGQQVHELPLEGSTVARFSPDGRWLMTHTSFASCRLWEVGTWREVRRFDYAGFAFSPDSRLLALGDIFGVIRLVETATGREVARLIGPEPLSYAPACFTPDGTQLIASSSSGSLYVWDLRLIRQQLKELGLDWDWPEFPPADPASQAPRPRQVEVLAGDLAKAIELNPRDAAAWNRRGNAHHELNQLEQALANYSKAIELDPEFASAWSNRGWVYCQLNHMDEAIADLTRALELNPKFVLAWTNRSVAYLRLGQLEKARADSAKAIELDPTFASAWFNRGEAHRQLGQLEQAITDYRMGIRLGTLPKPSIPLAQSHLALALNNLAWRLASSPDPKAHAPERAVELAKEAVELKPEGGAYWNTLGVAHYRAGAPRAAIEALEKSMQLQQGGASLDWLFLAMAHWKLGSKPEARKWYDRAALWIDKNQPNDAELRRFRAEAAELLGVKEKKD